MGAKYEPKNSLPMADSIPDPLYLTFYNVDPFIWPDSLPSAWVNTTHTLHKISGTHWEVNTPTYVFVTFDVLSDHFHIEIYKDATVAWFSVDVPRTDPIRAENDPAGSPPSPCGGVVVGELGWPITEYPPDWYGFLNLDEHPPDDYRAEEMPATAFARSTRIACHRDGTNIRLYGDFE